VKKFDPNITLEEISVSYELTASNADADLRADEFGQAVEQLILNSVGEEEPEPETVFGKRTKKVKDGARKWIAKTGVFVGKMLPLATIACGVVASASDVSAAMGVAEYKC
jgi:hypothetical protein